MSLVCGHAELEKVFVLLGARTDGELVSLLKETKFLLSDQALRSSVRKELAANMFNLIHIILCDRIPTLRTTDNVVKLQEISLLLHCLSNLFTLCEKQIQLTKQQDIYNLLYSTLLDITNKAQTTHLLQLRNSLLLALSSYFSSFKNSTKIHLRSLIIQLKSYLYAGMGSSDFMLQKLSLRASELLGTLVSIKEYKRDIWSGSICSALFPVSALAPTHEFHIIDTQKLQYTRKNLSGFSLYHLIIEYKTENLFLRNMTTIESLLSDSSLFLANADDDISQSLFLGFPQQQGIACFQLHISVLSVLRELRQYLPNEYKIQREKLFQLLAVLLKNSPYNKLRKKILAAVFELLLSYLPTIQPNGRYEIPRGVMDCFGKLFSYSNEPIEEILEMFAVDWEYSLFDHLFDLLASSDISFVDVSEILSMLSICFGHYHISPEIQNFVCQIQSWMLSYADKISTYPKNVCESYFSCLAQIILKFPEIADELWKNSFPLLLQYLVAPETPIYIQGYTIRLLNRVGASQYENLSQKNFYSLCEIFLQKITPANAFLRSLALEGVINLVPLASDAFMLSVARKFAEALSATESNSIRIRASFLLYDYIPLVDSSVDEEFWNKYFVDIFQSMEDSLLRKVPEKLQLGTIRTLGRLGKHAPSIFLNFIAPKHSETNLSRIFHLLLDQLGFSRHVKIQWNACVASGIVLQNQSIYSNKSYCIIEKVLVNLANLTWQSENLKIRIHAARALSSLSLLSQFGDSFTTVQDSLRIAETTLELTPATDRATLQNKILFQQELQKLRSRFNSM